MMFHVATRPYKPVTRIILASLKDFGLKKPNPVEVRVVLDNSKNIVSVLVNQKVYKEAKYGELNAPYVKNDLFYVSGIDLAQKLGFSLREAGFTVSLVREVKN